MKVDSLIKKIQESLQETDMKSILHTQVILQQATLDPELSEQICSRIGHSNKNSELYRDRTNGFVLLAYTEIRGAYRIPHNHGDAWVIYSILEGQVEMGNYFKLGKPKQTLILKNREILNPGDTRIYYPGEIHDTRCLSEKGFILRLTSCDLRDEEIQGRMERFSV